MSWSCSRLNLCGSHPGVLGEGARDVLSGCHPGSWVRVHGTFVLLLTTESESTITSKYV